MNLTETDAAAKLGLKPKTLANWRSLKQGPPFRKAGRRIVYDLRALEEWAVAQVLDGTPGLEPKHYGIVPAINGIKGNSRLTRIRDILQGNDRPDRLPQ